MMIEKTVTGIVEKLDDYFYVCMALDMSQRRHKGFARYNGKKLLFSTKQYSKGRNCEHHPLNT
jgi:hypothetical protein